MTTWSALTTRTWGSLYIWSNPLGSAPVIMPLPPTSGFGRLLNQSIFRERSMRTSSGRTMAKISSDYFFGQKATAVNTNWPLTGTSVAFNASPFSVWPYNTFTSDNRTVVPSQTATKLIYTDISDRIQEVDASMGRQYELDLISAGEATFNILDREENFNPTNPTSSYYPNVKVYRAIFDGAMWPPFPSGLNVNLLNMEYGVDPTLESYAPASLPLPFIQFWSRASQPPEIFNNNAYAGTRSLGITVNPSGSDYIAWIVPCIPGQRYTTSVYVKLAQPGGFNISVLDGNETGTSAYSFNSYQRIAVTFTATKPLQTMVVRNVIIPGQPSVNFDTTMYMDAFQHEVGGVANAFSTTGPVIYGLFGGYVERWPRNWNYHGTYGMAQITATDGFAQLSNQKVDAPFRGAVLNKNPDYYWPLNDGSDATRFTDQSGNNQPAMLPNPAHPTTGTIEAGSSNNVPGDAGGTGVALTGNGGSDPNGRGPGLQVGILSKGSTPINCGAHNADWVLSLGMWVVYPANNFQTPPGSVGTTYAASFGSSSGFYGANGASYGLFLGLPNTAFSSILWGINYGTVAAQFFFPQTPDGQPHYIFATAQYFQSIKTVFMVVRRDNQIIINSSINVSATFGTTDFDFRFPIMQIGAINDPTSTYSGWNGTYSHVAVWNRGLSQTEIDNLWAAGDGFAGDTTGTRIDRLLQPNQFTVFDFDTGQSTLQASQVSTNIGSSDINAMLDEIQAITTTENGNFFFDGFGTAVFQDRTFRYNNSIVSTVFGEDFANGEIPYSDDVIFDYDPTLVYNDIEVDQVNGAVGLSSDSQSQSDYGTRSIQITSLTNSSNEVSDYANWILASHKDPHQRVESITINPAANPALWPVALGLKFGDRVTVKRRTAIGFTMSQDYFIERIERSRDQSMNFNVTFQMSPIEDRQPWVLEDPRYGILDQTTLLGF